MPKGRKTVPHDMNSIGARDSVSRRKLEKFEFQCNSYAQSKTIPLYSALPKHTGKHLVDQGMFSEAASGIFCHASTLGTLGVGSWIVIHQFPVTDVMKQLIPDLIATLVVVCNCNLSTDGFTELSYLNNFLHSQNKVSNLMAV